MRECHAFDFVTLGTQRVESDEGLRVPGTIAKAGNVQEYRAFELGLDGDPNRLVRLYRPREEVAKSAATFARKPLTANHPPKKWITPKDWKRHAIGDAGDSVAMSGDDMVAELLFRDEAAIADLKSGKVALSCGYKFRFDDSKTKTPEGIAVDGWMTDIVGNHIAHVGRGRGGPGCIVADETEDKHMSTRTTKIGGLNFELDITAADAADAVTAQMVKMAADQKAAEELATASEQRAVTAESEVKTHLERIKAQDTEIAQLKAAPPAAPSDAVVEKAAETRTKVCADAETLSPGIKTAGKGLDAIRREALTASATKNTSIKGVCDSLLGGAEVEKADAGKIESAFVSSVSVLKNSTAADSGLGAALLSTGTGDGAGKSKEATATDADPTAGMGGYEIYKYRMTHRARATA